MRAWLPLLAACSAAAEPAPTVIHPVAAPAPPPVRARAPQVAASSSIIAITALTADGGAAATSDFHHLLRLWPTLDGTREPLVVTGPAPDAIALTRADHGFQLATLDGAGAIQILRIAQDGAQLPAQLVDSPLAYAQLEATRTGFVALRIDDAVELVATDGTRTTIAPPHAHIERLAVRGDAIAAFANNRARVLRDGAWGEPSIELPFKPETACVSTDGARLAGRRDDGVTVEITLATGAVRELDHFQPIGYVDATTLALHDFYNVELAHTDGTEETVAVKSSVAADLPTTVADGVVASGVGIQLALVRDHRVAYLGYDEVDAWPLRGGPRGVVARVNHPAMIDSKLELVPMGAENGQWMDVVALDDRYAAALHRDWSEEMELRRVDIIEQKTGKQVAKLDADARLDAIAWEPSTHLLATLSVAGAKLFRYADGAVTPAGNLPGAPDKVFLLDPALAHGDLALVVESNVASRIGPDLVAHDPQSVRGQLLAVDRAGTIVDRKGVPFNGPAFARISPDLKTVAFFNGSNLALVDRDGRARWSTTAWGLRDLAWTPNGRMLVAASGLLEIDPSTGATMSKRCGWRFSLSPTVHTGTPAGDSACDL